MSLLNEVLRDLQARGASEADPLAGLNPVTRSAPIMRRLAPLLWLVGAVAVALLWPLLRPEAQVIAASPAPAIENEAEPIAPVVVTAKPKRLLPAPAATPATREPAQEETRPVSPAPVAAVPVENVEPDTLAVVDSTTPDTATPIISRRESADPGAAATASIRRGLQALRAGKPLEAARFFEDALRTDPGNSEAWQYLYAARAGAGLQDGAEQALQRGLGASRSATPLAKLYARLLLERGDAAAAIRVLQRYRPTAASDTEYDTLLAGLLLRHQQFAAAGEIYQQLIDRDAAPGAWWIGLAMSNDSLGDRAAALAAFERALRADGLEPPLASYAQQRIAELRSNG
ncbi:MAG: tetratricopeptide repeat protein [Gammaproteobacteria bacterium]|nr:tetratricopeptide repeat protein [Gammaproteobacteria bacterium]